MSTSKPSVPTPKPQTTPLTVLITGASRGIGFELVRQFTAAHPHNVVIAGVRDPHGDTVKALNTFAAQHNNVHIIPLDVNSEQSIRQSVDKVQSLSPHVDVLINNAGVYGKEYNDPLKATPSQFSSILQTNLIGPFTVIQSYAPLLQLSSSPKVVNVSSSIGSNVKAKGYGRPLLSYGVSKAGLNYLTTVFAKALPQVTVLAVHPGWVATDMGRGGGEEPPVQPSDAVQAMRYYIAEKGTENSGEFLDIMTGEVIPY
jgi:NAD(P)-dependent dehydrogenase (short-subunit alcohol dehydrogenase family)